MKAAPSRTVVVKRKGEAAGADVVKTAKPAEAAAVQAVAEVGPGRYCTPRHMLPDMLPLVSTARHVIGCR